MHHNYYANMLARNYWLQYYVHIVYYQILYIIYVTDRK